MYETPRQERQVPALKNIPPLCQTRTTGWRKRYNDYVEALKVTTKRQKWFSRDYNQREEN